MATRLERTARWMAARGRADTVADMAAAALRIGPIRHHVFRTLREGIAHDIAHADAYAPNRPLRVKQDRTRLTGAMVRSAERALDRGLVSNQVFRKLLRSMVVGAMLREEHTVEADTFRATHDGKNPPGLIMVSPGKVCNLHCTGCYASSGANKEKLAWDVFERIVREARDFWNLGLIVVSGGEPLAYHDGGRGLLDMAEAHPEMFFLVYTNGTLITAEVAARMARLGNVTPAISVEGFETSTDARRGADTFQKITQAMYYLRLAGVPFGVSMTATRHNAEELLSDALMDFLFEEQGASYAWLFHYMPIGRGITLDLMPTPEQRAWMWRRTWDLIEGRGYFIADFWNLGTCSDGCISAGREGGYMYIDWNGNVMPCVFMPYVGCNINEVYQSGGDLNDVLQNPFFKAIRRWQDAYAYQAATPDAHGNWLLPCPIRDHHADFRQILTAVEPDPEDDAARQAMLDPDYRDGMIAYATAVADVLDPIWEREYLGQPNGNGQLPQREPSPNR